MAATEKETRTTGTGFCLNPWTVWKKSRNHLTNEIRYLQDSCVALEAQIIERKEANSKLKGAYVAMHKKVDALASEVNDMEKSFRLQKAILENCRKEIEDLEQTWQVREVNQKMYLLSELCWHIQSLIYRKVLPNSYHENESYKVKYIEEDIDAMENEEERKTASQVWAKLKAELEWESKEFSRTISSIQEPRIYKITIGPEISEGFLLQTATQLNDAGIFGSKTLKNVEKLINIWKKLVEMQ